MRITLTIDDALATRLADAVTARRKEPGSPKALITSFIHAHLRGFLVDYESELAGNLARETRAAETTSECESKIVGS